MSRMNKYVGIMLLSIAVLLLTPIATQVRGDSGDTVVARYGTTPTIDGTISDGEWDDASTVTFTVTGGTCTVYVKQDGSFLYVALNIPDTTYYTDDISHVFIDVEHDCFGPADDFLFMIYRDGETIEYALITHEEDGFFSYNWEWRIPDGWTAAFYSTGTGWQTEYSIEYSKIGVTAGEDETLGVMFETYDHIASGTYYGWPPGSDDDEPNTWADLTSPAPWFWIPGMPLGAVAAVTACFGGLGIRQLRRTPKKTT